MPDRAPETSLWSNTALLTEGWAKDVRLTLRGGRLARVETGVAPAPQDARYGPMLPGLSNLHSHAFQRGMAGLAETSGPDGDDFWSWREVMYRFLDRLTPEDVEAIAALAYIEMLEAGFTRVGEFHYLHHAPDGSPYADPAELALRIAAAANGTGIALSLLPVFYAHADFGGQPPKPGQRRFICSLDAFADLYARSRDAIAGLEEARIGVAPHSLRAVTPEELRALTALAPDGPIHIHAAEQLKEVEASIAFSGARPVEWLLGNAQIDARWCLIHATHMTAEETRGLARSGAVAGLCPITEANLGDGTFPAVDYLTADGRFGLGTDSNILIDAAGELRGLDYAQRLFFRKRNVLAGAKSSGRTLFDAAYKGGSRALAAESGGLAAGAPADFFALNPGHPTLAGRQGDAILDSWIFAGGPALIEAVWRGGKKLVEGGRHIRRDAAVRRFAATLSRLLS